MMMLAVNWGNAAVVALFSIVLVFIVLVLLIYILKLFGAIFAEKKSATPAVATATASDGISEEEVAAIAMAVNLFFNRHDEESDVLTFRQNHDVSAWQVRNISQPL